MALKTTSLMLNFDGSTFHLHALPEDIAPTVILVGDPNRTNFVAEHFDVIDVKKSHREFVLQTGRIKNKRFTVIGTGVGVGNIDIVLNELDELVNIDLENKTIKKNMTRLNIIRIGTGGALQSDIPAGSIVISDYAFAFDGLLNFYQHHYNDKEQECFDKLYQHFSSFCSKANLYLGEGNTELVNLFRPLGQSGITLTCTGFYGPQHRQLRAPIIHKNIIEFAQQFHFQQHRIANFEMETAAIYSLGKLLGHRCCSINIIVANRIRDEKLETPEKIIKQTIKKVFSLIAT